MEAVAKHCDRAMLLDSGRIVSVGSPEEITSDYEAINTREAQRQRAKAEEVAASEERSSPVPAGSGSPATYRPGAVGDSLQRFLTLTASLAVAEFKLHYLGSALGYLWSALRPLAYFAILYVLFSKVSNVGSGVENYGVYLLAGIVLWTFFTETVSGGVTSLTRNEGLLRKMRFPRLAIPASIVLRSLFNLGINLLLVAGFVFAVGITPRLSWLEVPLLIFLLAILAGGLAMLLSALYVRYRDVSQIWQVARQLLFFGSPILYVAGRYPEAVQEVLSLSPIAVILTQMRHAVVDPSAPSAAASVGDGTLLLIPLAVTLGIFCLGLWFFSREAPRVAERL
jgi:ABC-2 type transport system permease protein